MHVHSQIEIQGIVQGVGFRPFIARLATKCSQNGWVKNTSQGVLIAVEGLKALELLLFRLLLGKRK